MAHEEAAGVVVGAAANVAVAVGQPAVVGLVVELAVRLVRLVALVLSLPLAFSLPPNLLP